MTVAHQKILDYLRSFERAVFGDAGELLGVDHTVLKESAKSGLPS